MSEQPKKFRIPVTFSGLLDDVVDRHRITPEVDGSFFNRAILKNVFFAGRILLNDGYLINHPAALKQLLNEDSLLRSMIRSDFVRIVAREIDPDRFAETPERMAAKGVRSFGRIISRSDWPELKESLRRFAYGLDRDNRIDSWPPFEMHTGFKKLFNRIYDKSLSDLGIEAATGLDLGKFREQVEAHPSYADAPRTAVEAVATALADEGKIPRKAVAAIMNVANQCYHYNFAMGLSHSRKEPVVADTTIGRAFEDILDFDDAVELEIDNVPVLSVPHGFPIEKGAAYDLLLDPTSSLFEAKHEFLRTIDSAFSPQSNQSVRTRSDDVAQAAREYRGRLAEHFSTHMGFMEWTGPISSLVTFGFRKSLSAVGADYVLLAAKLMGGKSVSSFVNRLATAARRGPLSVALDPGAGTNDEFVYAAGDIKPRFASLAFNRAAIKEHVAGLPLMRR